MLAHPIPASDTIVSAPEEVLGTLRSTLAVLAHFADARPVNVASHNENIQPSPHKLAAAYAAANSITRRRFDALLREADTVARTGLGLIVERGAGPDRATIAAARFLGNSLSASLRRMENLVATARA
jgi:hypothetical protein